MSAIFEEGWGVKATGASVSGRARDELARIATWLIDQGAQVIIPACTEVSVALRPESFAARPLVDPLRVAAEVLLDVAYGIRPPDAFRTGDGNGRQACRSCAAGPVDGWLPGSVRTGA